MGQHKHMTTCTNGIGVYIHSLFVSRRGHRKCLSADGGEAIAAKRLRPVLELGREHGTQPLLLARVHDCDLARVPRGSEDVIRVQVRNRGDVSHTWVLVLEKQCQ